jgi:hypothetical protein
VLGNSILAGRVCALIRLTGATTMHIAQERSSPAAADILVTHGQAAGQHDRGDHFRCKRILAPLRELVVHCGGGAARSSRAAFRPATCVPGVQADALTQYSEERFRIAWKRTARADQDVCEARSRAILPVAPAPPTCSRCSLSALHSPLATRFTFHFADLNRSVPSPLLSPT